MNKITDNEDVVFEILKSNIQITNLFDKLIKLSKFKNKNLINYFKKKLILPTER